MVRGWTGRDGGGENRWSAASVVVWWCGGGGGGGGVGGVGEGDGAGTERLRAGGC